MTAPVTQQRASDAAAAAGPEREGPWRIRFIMPAEYDREDLPEPATDVVRLVEVPPQRVAAVRFSRVATDAPIEAQEKRLRAWLEARRLAPAGPPTYAYYNDPFTPGFLRRNEVLIALAD
jgi:hypothetical protein